MLTNFELMDLAKEYGVQLHGVYQKDVLLEQKPRWGNYIVNLESSTEGNGTHYVALIVRPEASLYWDSFGVWQPIEVTQFLSEFDPKPRQHEQNMNDVQDLASECCGWYCLGLFIACRDRNAKLYDAADRYTASFCEDERHNAAILKEKFRTMRGHTPSRFVRQRLLAGSVK